MGSVLELSCSVRLYGAQTGDNKAFELIADDFVQHAAGPPGRKGLRQTAVLEHDLGPERRQVHRTVVRASLSSRPHAATSPSNLGSLPGRPALDGIDARRAMPEEEGLLGGPLCVQSMVMLLTPTLGPDNLALVQTVVKPRGAAPTAGRQPACRSAPGSS